MNKKQKKTIRNISIAAVIFIISIIIEKLNIPYAFIISTVGFTIAYLTAGLGVLKKAFNNIKQGKVFDENFLMTIATVGAFIQAEYAEAVAVMLLYMLGEFFQALAVGRSRRSISELMDIRPDYANLKKSNGEIVDNIDPEEVKVGDIIVIKPGERVPLDGVVILGESMIDTVALTGESVPRKVKAGEVILSGSVNIDGLLEVEVTKEFGESTASKILDLVENASARKSNSENFITKFSYYYTPLVVGLAVFLAIVPPLLTPERDFSRWIDIALTFLVVSCPCALVISVPLSFFAGIGASSRLGILVKGSNYLEALAETKKAVFDKTGTLTKGVFSVVEVISEGMEEKEILRLAMLAEQHSGHPIALSVKDAYKQRYETYTDYDKHRIENLKQIPGMGISINIDEKEVLLGNAGLMEEFGIEYKSHNHEATLLYMAVDSEYAACIVISDIIKDDAKQAINELKSMGISDIIMLTGDRKEVADAVAGELGINEVYSSLLPGDKLGKVEELLEKNTNPKHKLVFVGDGINDAPVLARADIGIAMGGLGSDAAIEAADVVIMNDEPSKIAVAIRLAKRTLGIATQNIVFALLVKVVVLSFTAFGMVNMWAAVFADVGVTLLAIANAMRNLNIKKV
jgi:heavy metal translocating P-type ATPase